MTCIVGLVDDDDVIIGADSAGVCVSTFSMRVRADEKVFVRDDFIFGFTTSFRMGQLIRYKLQIPRKHESQDLYEYMVVDFVDAVRACLKGGGFTTIRENEERGGNFLVGHEGRLFGVEGDFQVAESSHPFDAVGCGMDLALGAMVASECVKDPFDRVTLALQAAAQFSAGVSDPFTLKKLSRGQPK